METIVRSGSQKYSVKGTPPAKKNVFSVSVMISDFRKGLGGGESPEHDGADFQLDTDMSPGYNILLFVFYLDDWFFLPC